MYSQTASGLFGGGGKAGSARAHKLGEKLGSSLLVSAERVKGSLAYPLLSRRRREWEWKSRGGRGEGKYANPFCVMSPSYSTRARQSMRRKKMRAIELPLQVLGRSSQVCRAQHNTRCARAGGSRRRAKLDERCADWREHRAVGRGSGRKRTSNSLSSSSSLSCRSGLNCAMVTMLGAARRLLNNCEKECEEDLELPETPGRKGVVERGGSRPELRCVSVPSPTPKWCRW